MLSAYGISRSGNRAEAILDGILGRIMHSETSDNGVIFVWQPEQKPDEYNVYRVSEQNENRRNIDDVSSKEILNAAIQVLSEQGGMQKNLTLLKKVPKSSVLQEQARLLIQQSVFAVDNAIKKTANLLYRRTEKNYR